MKFCNIATYKFIAIQEERLPGLCKKLKKACSAFELKGTILLSTEGINLFLAGAAESIEKIQGALIEIELFSDLEYKYSYSDFIPFKKLSVKVRHEIVTFKQQGIDPAKDLAPYISPEQLHSWLTENKDVVLLDTRNDFEFAQGTFDNAVQLNIKNFRDFPNALQNNDALPKDKPIVTFCTGGIRCEKAAIYLLKQGFKEVYQLHGGLLNYFEKCNGDYYHGDCFVFDDRIALNCQLEPVS